MKRLASLFAMGLCLVFASGTAYAAHGHYVSGIEGIKAATFPGEGFYWRMYNVNYTANRYNDNSGNKAGRFNADIYVLANRFIYNTGYQLLGADFGFDVIVPIQNTNLRMAGAFDREKFGFGDILVEPLILAWHGERWDALVAAGVYLPTGYYKSSNPASPGKGFWTFMGTAGGTVFLDAEKSWHASILARYEVHTRQEDTHITPGNDFHFEWGAGKTFAGLYDVGVAGYCGWQMTDDSGSGSGDLREKTYGIGPELGAAVPSLGLHVSLRSVWEFENRNASQGNITTLTLTKAF